MVLRPARYDLASFSDEELFSEDYLAEAEEPTLPLTKLQRESPFNHVSFNNEFEKSSPDDFGEFAMEDEFIGYPDDGEMDEELEGLGAEEYYGFEDKLIDNELDLDEEEIVDELFYESENGYGFSEVDELEDETLNLAEEEFFLDLKRLWSRVDSQKRDALEPINKIRFLLWQNIYATKKSYFADEPRNNIDQFPFPYWIKLKDFASEFRKKYASEADSIMGDLSKAVTAQYFVIHDTAVAADFSLARIKKKPNGIHLWINAETDSVRDKDWQHKGLGTKIERVKNNCFLHVEVTRSKTQFNKVKEKLLAKKAAKIRRKKFKVTNKKLVLKLIQDAGGVRNFGTYYTDKQYELLAYAYLSACIRKGSLLTITIHREVDRSVARERKGRWQYGHNDPQFFDISYFYSVISRLLRIPGKVTYGIQEDRVLALGQSNRSGRVNVFVPYVSGDVSRANQYGSVKKLITTKYSTIKLKYGLYYRADKLKVKFTC